MDAAPAWRRWVPRVLLVLAAFLLIVGCLGVWAHRQLLNTDNWVHTSSALLQDPAIQNATAAYLADQVASNVTAQDLAAKLPDRLKPFAPQAAAALSELSERIAKRAMRSGAFQGLWKKTNRLTHEQFINLVEGDKNKLINKFVVLDLRPLIGKLGSRIGLGDQFVNQLPEDQGRIEIISEDDVQGLRKAVDVLNTVAWWATFLSIVLFSLAVYLSPPDRRRGMLMTVGFTVAGTALLVLVVRRIAGGAVVQAVTDNGAAEPAAAATWRIATTMLQHIGQAVFGLGIVIAAAAWFAGPARWAVGGRKWVSPVLQDHRAAVWGTAVVAILVVLAWAPLPAMRSALGAVFFVALIAGGLLALQRQIDREYPTAH
jgi:hypothetical protein